MSEPEKFLDRWSRRKREAADEPAPVEAKDATAGSAAAGRRTQKSRPRRSRSIPPACRRSNRSAPIPISARFCSPAFRRISSRAALRRAWSADPAIRDFIGLVENGWDFNDPDGIPGFGPINAGDVANLLARVIGAPPAETDAPQQVARGQDNSEQNPPPAIDSEPAQQLPQDQPAPNQDLAAPEKDSMQRSEDDVASQYNSDDRENFPPSRQRGHGGALPK